MELIKDKWYKVYDGKVKLWHRDNHSWFIKFDKLEGNVVKSKEYIYTGDSPILNMGGNFGAFDDYTYKLADMNEVSKFLPEGHVDKIESLVGRYVKVSEKLKSAEGIYGFKVGDILKVVTADSNGYQEARSTINSGHYFGYNCIQDDRLELLPIDFKFNENNMSKVEAPKTFAIKSDSKHLKKAFQEELKELGYTIAYEEDLHETLVPNISGTKYNFKTYTLTDYSRLCNYNELVKSDIVFTLPEDYSKAIEYAKSAIQSEYWNQSKVTKLDFGEVEFTIESGKDYAETAYGKVTKEEVRKAIEYIENPPKLANYPLMLHYKGTRSSLYNAEKLVSGLQLGFGCQSGSYTELVNIYKAFEN